MLSALSIVICFIVLIGAPHITSMSINAFTLEEGSFSAKVLLGKCNHSSAFVVYDVFFLTSDTAYLIARSSNITWFPNLLIQNTRKSGGGRYHCLLQYQGNKYRSEKYVVTFKEFLRFRLNISYASNQIKEFTQYVLTEIERRMSNYYQQNKTFGIRFIEHDVERNYITFIVAISKSGADNKPEVCSTFGKVFDIDKWTHFESSSFNIISIKISPLDCCSAENITHEQFKSLLKYDVTLASSSPVIKQCPYNEAKKVFRYCRERFPNNSEWTDVDFSQCKINLKSLNQENITATNIVEISENLREIVIRDTLNNTADIVLVTSVVEKIVGSLSLTHNNENETDVITENILDIANKFLDTDQEVFIHSNETVNITSSFLRSLDAMAVHITNQSARPEKIFEKKNLALTIQNRSNSFTLVAKDENNLLDMQRVDVETTNDFFVAKILVPQSLLTRANNTQIYSYIYRSGLFFSQPFYNESIQSIVLAASVPERKISNLEDPVIITFKDMNANKTKKTRTSNCHFWLPGENAWSTEGCQTYPGKIPETIRCECKHLTNFALLLDVNQSGSNPLSLSIITWIGCGISIFGLLLTVVTFTVFSNLRKRFPSKILLCFSFSLLALLIIFLTGIEQVKPRIGCQFIASLIQYFLLATFFWMSVEGWALYQSFVKVFGQEHKKLTVRSSIYGWGGPFVITSITAGVATDSLGPQSKDDIQFCVLRGLPFYIGIVVPVAFILMMNLIILVLAVRGIAKSRFTKHKKGELLATARIAFACSILLGTAWVFGILAIGDLKSPFQWLFCIFNSLQGLFIFLFYTVRNPEARKEWRIFFRRQKFGRYLLKFKRSNDKYKISGEAMSFHIEILPCNTESTSSYIRSSIAPYNRESTSSYLPSSIASKHMT